MGLVSGEFSFIPLATDQESFVYIVVYILQMTIQKGTFCPLSQ